MSPPILGSVNEPHADQYQPRAVTQRTPLVEQAKELAEWMRHRGYRCQSLVVTRDRIELVGLVDDFARASRRVAAAPSDPLLPGWDDR